MSFLNNGRYQIYLERVKSAMPHPTVFLHGNLASHQWFKPFLGAWLGDKKHEALLIDWRGCGLSDAPKTDEDMHPDALSNDILGVMDDAGFREADLIGHSTGGLLALTTALMAPNRFRKIVALDPVGSRGIKFDPSLEGAFVQMAENKDLAGQIVASTIYGFDLNSSFYQEVVREDAFTAAKKIGLKLLKNLDAIDYTDAFRKIKQPTLLLHGEHDVILPVADTQALAELLPNSEFELVSGQGHCWNIENPQTFAERVYQFLYA